MREPFIAEGQLTSLRPMTEADCEMVVRWRNQDRVRKNYIYLEKLTVEQERRYFREKVETGKAVHLIMCDRTDGDRPVGCVVFGEMEAFYADPGNTMLDIGYFLGEEDASGKGIAGEGMQLGVRYGFRNLGAAIVCCRIFTSNLPSLLGCEKCGFRIREFLPGVERSDGSRADMYLLAITPEELEKRFPQKVSGDLEEKTVSFIIPCYRSEHTLEQVVREIDETMGRRGREKWEILMINDASPDDTWGTICRLTKEDSARRTGVCFARNFGQHAALMAGIGKAKGDVLICLDDDGQTPACEAGRLLDAVEAGADAVYARYTSKQHSAFRNFGTAMNEAMTHVMLGKPRGLYVSSYFAMKRFVAEEVLRYKNSYPYLVGLVLRATKNIVNVEVKHRKRAEGTSGYTLTKLLALWMNGFTAFSIKPLRIATVMGVISAAAGFVYGIYTIVKKIVNPAVPVGFSAMMSAVVFFGGAIMLVLGMLGEYIGRTYISVNSAPQYVIQKTTEEKEHAS